VVATLACWQNYESKRKYDGKKGNVANKTLKKKRMIYDGFLDTLHAY
jgi:hypothetical protein